MNQTQRIELIRQAHAKALADQTRIGGDLHVVELFPVAQEDVLDEAQHLEALDHVKPTDFDADENEVDMDSISPIMKGVYS